MPWYPLSRVVGDLLAITDYIEMEESREIEELSQVYNLQSIQVTERQVLLNCKFPVVIIKGRGMQACIEYE